MEEKENEQFQQLYKEGSITKSIIGERLRWLDILPLKMPKIIMNRRTKKKMI